MKRNNFYSLFGKIAQTFTVAAVCFFMSVSHAEAQEITAIDFNGDLLGKVIPDGKVVSLDNQLIGNVTADSLIVNFDGELIGGVIPQGIAIGNDNKLLGKVNNDGSVRMSSGKIIGKVLPTGLVIDDYFDVIGAVLFPGLVYSDGGRTVGRLTGDGLYTNLQGQEIGFVSPDGYAYRRVGTDYVLDGRLISSKMVVSESGEFIGSVTPGGNITDFDAVTIGFIKANGFAYNENNTIIGRIVRSGYAFDNFGRYIGFVTYNGEVLDKDKLVGHLRSNGKIAGEKGEIIGFSVDISATATDSTGKFLGRVMPNGKIYRAREEAGVLGAKGIVYNKDGNAVGQIVRSGPVFDYKGSLVAHALKNGKVILLEGTPTGYVIGNKAYDNNGRLTGATLDELLVVNGNNKALGIVGINASVFDGDDRRIVSPFGYVFNTDGGINGSALPLGAIYNISGIPVSEISPNGELYNKGSLALGKLTQSGVNIDERNRILGKNVCPLFVVDESGSSLGNLSEGNLVLNKGLKITAKVLPDNSVVPAPEEDSVDLSPKTGNAYQNNIVISYTGNLLGYTNDDGSVRDFNGNRLGKVSGRGMVVDNNGSVIGGLIGYDTVIDDDCTMIGVIDPKGEIKNFRNVSMGRVLLNGQAVSESGNYIGYAVNAQSVVDYSGNVLGVASAGGRVLNYADEQLGCLNKKKLLKNADNTIIGGSVEYYPVMNFNGTVIGRSILDGSVVNDKSMVIGYMQPDGNVNSKTGVPVGGLFKYKVAFDDNNKFIGRVLENGKVVNAGNEEIGQVDFVGYVSNKDGAKIGYALYDFYIYDNNFSVMGYINKDGTVLSLLGQKLGTLDRGFLIDRGGQVIGRGNRDFYIRDESNLVLGELSLDGELVNVSGEVLGTINKEGNILDAEGKTIATAKPLQFYNLTLDRQKVYDENGNLIGYVNKDGSVVDENGKLIGLVNDDGIVISANGNIIGGTSLDWYEKAPQTAPKDNKLPEVGVNEYQEIKEKYRKSLGIALTPDGEYLGEIMEDGNVVDKSGNVLGHKMPDGLVIDNDGTLIGIEEASKPNTDGMFIPAGTFGSGGAYGVGAGSGTNLGPGGGFGPGERYDPQRAAALDAAQNQRRQGMAVGKISTNVRKEAFDGYQKNWDEQGVSKAISSWRVKLDEMIFADKPIPAVLSRSIDSNNPTPITAFVERNIYAEEGRNIIIPAGSRLVGTLGGLTGTTETTSQSAKVQISWERLIRPDGVLFTFAGITADAQGRGGALGYLDQQLFKKYTLPIMTTALTSYTSYLMADDDKSSGETESSRQQAANDARQNFLNEMNQVFEQILADKTNIKPLTYVPAGTRIIVFPNVDLWMRTEERDAEASTGQGSKKDVFIDDEKVTNDRKLQENKRAVNISASSASQAGNVLYEADDAGVEAVDAPPKLIDDSSVKNKKKAKGQPTNPGLVSGSTPPPPPTYSTTPGANNASSGSSNSNQNSDSSVPQLF